MATRKIPGADLRDELSQLVVKGKYGRWLPNADGWPALAKRVAELTAKVKRFTAYTTWPPGTEGFRAAWDEVEAALLEPGCGLFLSLSDGQGDVFTSLNRYGRAVAALNACYESSTVTKPKVYGNGKPLTDLEKSVYDYICKNGPVMGSEICNRTGCEQSTLTSRIIPGLKEKRGILNQRGVGYYSPAHYSPS